MKVEKMHLFGWASIKITLSMVALLVSLSHTASAQEPRSVPLGPFELESSLLLEYSKDDNIFQSAADPTSTSIFTVTPSFELTFDNGVSGFSLAYLLEDATHSETGDEDYTDQSVVLTLGNIVADMHRLEFNAVYFESHDRRSDAGRTGRDVLLADDEQGDLDLFEDLDYEFAYTLGTEDSLFRARLALGEFEREYTTNRVGRPEPTTNTARFDREESRVGAELFWNLSSVFTASLSYLQTDIDYVLDEELEGIAPQNDGEEEVYAIGFEWEPTDTISADVLVGVVDRATDTLGSEKNSYWDMEISWDLRSYSTLAFLSSSIVGETSNADGSFTVEESVGVQWTHDWSDLFRTELSYAIGDIEYSDSTRVDQNEAFLFSAAYEFRPQFIVGLFVEKTLRSSDVSGPTGDTDEYDQNVYGISALFRL